MDFQQFISSIIIGRIIQLFTSSLKYSDIILENFRVYANQHIFKEENLLGRFEQNVIYFIF